MLGRAPLFAASAKSELSRSVVLCHTYGPVTPLIPQPGSWTASRVIRWAMLALSLLMTVLILKRPAPLAPAPTAEQSAASLRSFEQKIAGLQPPRPVSSQDPLDTAIANAHADDPIEPVRLTADELTAVLTQQFAAGEADMRTQGSTMSLLPPSVRLSVDQLELQFGVKKFGMDLYITLGGRASMQDGNLKLDFSEARLGSLPLPAALINHAMRRKADAGQMRLPPNIAEVKLENGELVIVPRAPPHH